MRTKIGKKFTLSLVAVAASIVFTSASHSEDGAAMNCTTICRSGLPMLPPTIQGTVMRELAGPNFGNGDVKSLYSKDGYSEQQVADAWKDLQASVLQQRERDENQRTEVEVIRTTNDVFMWGVTAAGELSGPGSIMVDATMGVYKYTVDKALDQQLSSIAKARDETLQNMAASAFNRLRAANKQETDVLLARMKAGDKQAGEELSKRISNGPLNDLLESDRYKALEPDERAALHQQVTNLLADKINDVEKLSRQTYTDLTKRLDGQAKRVVELEKFKTTTEKRLTKLVANLVSVKSAVISIDKTVREQADQIALTQQMLMGQMPPRDQLYALRAGLNARMGNEDRAKAIERLEKIVSVQDFHDTAKDAINFAGDMGHLMARAGLLDASAAENLSKNVAIANSTIDMVTTIALSGGNPLAIVGAVAGFSKMFGGSGPSAEMQKLSQMDRKLDEILRLQRETLQAIAQLSRQLEDSTNRILARIDHVGRVVDIANVKLDEIVEGGRQKCVQFQEEAFAAEYSTRVNGFPTYESRVIFFNSEPERRRDFKACLDYLRTVARPLVDKPPFSYVLDGYKVSFSQLENTFTARVYKPTLQMHELFLGISANTPNCYNRFHAALNGNPRSFSVVRHADFACADADISTSELKAPGALALIAQSDEPVNSVEMLPGVVRMDVLADAYKYLTLVTPFLELRDANTELLPKNEAELMMAFSVPAQTSDFRDIFRTMKGYESNFHNLRHSVNLAGAQETLLSGLFIAKPISELLIASRFGESLVGAKDDVTGSDAYAGTYLDHLQLLRERLSTPTVDPNQELDRPRLERRKKLLEKFMQAHQDTGKDTFSTDCRVPDNWQLRAYQVVLCVAARQPQIIRNAVTYLVLKDLETRQERAGSTAGYEAAFRMSNEVYLSKVLPSLAPYAVWVKSGHSATADFPGQQGQWFLRLTRHSGEPWLIALPLPMEIANGRVMYRAQLTGVDKLRAAISHQIDAYRMAKDAFRKNEFSAEKQLLVSRAALVREFAIAKSAKESNP